MSSETPRARKYFEYSVLAAIVGILVTVLLNALNHVQEKAERTIMETTLSNMESGLKMEISTRTIQGKAASIRELIGGNPVQWLASSPQGYSGICGGQRAPGEWCYDSASRELVYRPRHDRSLEFRVAGTRELRWRVGLVRDTSGRQANENEPVGQIGVIPTTSFVWH